MVRVAVDGRAARISSDLASLDCLEAGSLDFGLLDDEVELTVESELAVLSEPFVRLSVELSTGITMIISVLLESLIDAGVVLSPVLSPVTA